PAQTKIDLFARSGSYSYTKVKNDKLTKALIMRKKLKDSITYCSLTTNLWTSRNRQGYPHTANVIQEKLEEVIENWGLTGKLVVGKGLMPVEIITKTSTYLRAKIDVSTPTLSVSSTSEARKDARRLKEIQLTDNEWDLMQDIVNILGSFFEVTELLGGSEYVTFSYMIPSILGLIDKLDCSTDHLDKSNNINFEMPNLVFDNNVGFVDAQEEEEDDEELFLAYLLDSRFKKLRFATSTQQLQPLDFNEQLSAENNQRKCKIYQKTFIKSLFMQNTVDEPINEIISLQNSILQYPQPQLR
ncbi:22907_t:CDS:2, partial [Cetraspora pellucida]